MEVLRKIMGMYRDGLITLNEMEAMVNSLDGYKSVRLVRVNGVYTLHVRNLNTNYNEVVSL